MQAGLGDAKQQSLAAGGFGFFGLRHVFARGFGGFVGVFEGGFQGDVAFLELGAAGVDDLDALADQIVAGAEAIAPGRPIRYLKALP